MCVCVCFLVFLSESELLIILFFSTCFFVFFNIINGIYVCSEGCVLKILIGVFHSV